MDHGGTGHVAGKPWCGIYIPDPFLEWAETNRNTLGLVMGVKFCLIKLPHRAAWNTHNTPPRLLWSISRVFAGDIYYYYYFYLFLTFIVKYL